jgi:hypothetical protein
MGTRCWSGGQGAPRPDLRVPQKRRCAKRNGLSTCCASSLQSCGLTPLQECPHGWAASSPPPRGSRKLGAARRFLLSTPKGQALPVPAPQGGARKLGAARRFLVSALFLLVRERSSQAFEMPLNLGLCLGRRGAPQHIARIERAAQGQHLKHVLLDAGVKALQGRQRQVG